MSSSTTEVQASGSPVGLTHKQITTIILGLMAGLFLAALDQTIVTTAIRTIGDELHGLSIQAWVTTAYLITSTISTPLYGKLSDIYGRRPLFLIAITLFVIGSLACSFSTSMYQLAAFRAFQGLGAGGLFSMALAILADIVPARERARYQGYFLAVFGTSSVIGPLVGGAFAGASSILWITGWRWVFLVNVPIGIAALFIVYRVLHIPHVRHDHRIDWWGAVALIVGLVPILIVAEQGREWGWDSARVLSMIAVGVIGLVAFVLIEMRMKDEALIPMRLFRTYTFSLGSGLNMLIGIGMFGALSCIPLYLQLVKGATPTSSGLLMIPMMVGIMGGSVLSGQLTSKTGRYKIFPVLGTALMTVAFFLLLTIQVDTPYWQLDIYFILIGLGLGLNMQTLLIAVQNAVPARDIGVATASATFFRQVGGTLGVAVFLSLLFNSLSDKIGAAVQTASQQPDFQQAVAQASGATTPQGFQEYLLGLGAKMQSDSSFLTHVGDVIAYPFRYGFVQSTHLVYIVGGILMAIAFLLTLTLKETPLRTMSAIAERQAEEASLAAETLEVADTTVTGDDAELATVAAAPSRSADKAGSLEDSAPARSSGNGHAPTPADAPAGKGTQNGQGSHSLDSGDRNKAVTVQEFLAKTDFVASAPGRHRQGRHEA